MNCIFCGKDASKSVSKEHVIPETLGNHSLILEPGIVCDKCNNYFAIKVEHPILNSRDIQELKLNLNIPNKKGKTPTFVININDIPCVVSKTKNNHLLLGVDPENIEKMMSYLKKKTVISNYNPFNMINNVLFHEKLSRFLAKIAVEYLYLVFEDFPEDNLVYNPQIKPLINHARYGEPKKWSFSSRILNEKDREYLEADDLYFGLQLYTSKKIMKDDSENILLDLYCICIIHGVEYAISYTKSNMDSYFNYIKENGVTPYVEADKVQLIYD